MKKKLLAGLAVGVMMFGMAGVAEATTYSAFDDFSNTSPIGIWSYGEGTTGSTFMPLYNKPTDWTNMEAWGAAKGG